MRTSRRAFMKKSAAAAGGMLLPSFGLPARSYRRILGANDRIMVGLVGFSDRAKDSLIPAFQNHASELNAEILGISDIWNLRRDSGLRFMHSKTGRNVRIYKNNDELYADKDVDAVIISTADFQHALHSVEAAQNKKHAYVEKPFAETMEDNRAALKAVKESGIVLQIGSQRRSGPNYHAAAKYIASGKFGDITMVEMTWNVNQPGRWRRPSLVEGIREDHVDWKRYILNRPSEPFDGRKYVEYRLFWPYSSGIPGQWMCHQIDTVHWFTGYKYPRSVVANGGIYMWKDGRTNNDTLTAVFDYGSNDDPKKGFQVVYSSRMHNSAGGVKEIYYSNGGELNLLTNKVTPNGGLNERFAYDMNMKPFLLPETELTSDSVKVETAALTGVDLMTNLHMRNWIESMRGGKDPNGPVQAGYEHSIATIMTNAAVRTGEKVWFDEKTQEVMAGGKVFKY